MQNKRTGTTFKLHQPMKTLPIILLALSLTQTSTAQETTAPPQTEAITPCPGSTVEADVRAGDAEAVKRYLAGVDWEHFEAGNHLLPAIEAGRADIVELLVKMDPDKERGEVHGYEALELACGTNDLPLLQELIARGVGNPGRVFTFAALRGDIPALELQLAAGVDLHYNNDDALCMAANSGQEETVRFLLDRGANPDPQGEDYLSSPLSHAIGAVWDTETTSEEKWQSKKHIAKLLIERGADPNDPRLWLNMSLLFQATNRDIPKETMLGMLEGLLQSGMRPDFPLMSASYHNPDALRMLIQAGADVNTRGSAGGTALIMAACSGNTESAELLLRAGADVLAKDLHGHTARDYATKGAEEYGERNAGYAAILELLHVAEQAAGTVAPDDDAALESAIRAGDAEAVKRRLTEMAQEGRAPWHYLPPAMETGDAAIIRMVAMALPPGSRDDALDSVVELAIDKKDARLVRELLAAGCSSAAKAFRYALEHDVVEIADCLIDAGADLQIWLDQAVYNGKVDFVRRLLDRGADPNVRSSFAKETRTPFELVLFWYPNGDEYPRRFAILKLLLEHGLEAKSGLLRLAALLGTPEMMEAILNAGADINERDESGQTPLHHAITTDGTVDNVRFLLEHGADINARNEDGVTPLMLARYLGCDAVADLLIQYGADTTLKDKNGDTAQMIKERTEKEQEAEEADGE